MQKLEKRFRTIQNYKVVSFDIFDTLLKRDVFVPTDVFLIVEKIYENMNHISQSAFSIKRREAERKARYLSQYDEITLDEIYEFINFPESEKNKLKEIELEIESEILHYNPEILPLFKKCLKEGKSIYIISDMYLPRPFLEEILVREGIYGYRKLYLSCEYRKTKRSGKLFEAFCKAEKLEAKEIIHIGDSRYADYVGPRKAGIKSIYINRNSSNTLYMDISHDASSISERCLYAFINTRRENKFNRGSQIGFEVLGPIIYAYCQWLHQYVTERSFNGQIWFAARDMYLFKKAYSIIYGEQDNEEYIYLSRKSLRPAYAKAVGSITRSGDVFARGKYSLSEIVKYLGYSIDDVEINKDIDINKKQYDIRRLEQYPEIVRTLSSPSIEKTEDKLSVLCFKYLEQHGLYNHNILLADVGWHGTTQYILHAIQKHETTNFSIYGMYLGCLDGTKEKIGREHYQALIFDETDESWFKKGIILFEALILAPHGSTKQYEIKNGKICPVLSSSEPISDYIVKVQQGALKFIEEYSNSLLSREMELDSEFVSKAFENMICRPQKDELAAIGELKYDNFYCNKLAAPKNIIYYLGHIGELKYDLKYSPWRIGFLYRLFKLRLPYAKIYSFVRKKQGKMT